MTELIKGGFFHKDELSDLVQELDIQILSCGVWTQTNTGAISNNMLSCFKLVIPSQGQFVIESNLNTYTIDKQNVLLIPDNTIYNARCTSKEKVSFNYIFFNINNTRGFLYNHFFSIKEFYVYDNTMDANILVLLNAFLRDNTKTAGKYFQTEALLKILLIMIIDENYKNISTNIQAGKSYSLVKNVNDYILEHIEESIKVKDICNHFYISQSQLYRAFIDVNGESLKENIIRIKLDRSILLLKDPLLSINTISDMLGFNSIGHFSATFKRKLNTSPSKYRRLLHSTNKSNEAKDA
ncbi:MAG: AraC family transcriptional regulator [Erysipelotrichaceae bacterium]